MRIWSFTAAMLAATVCFAGDLQYNPQPNYDELIKQRVFENQVEIARVCMKMMATG
jgi:hypothetical protein